ncbi:hypothetical protein YC2023_011198 [Brassica napus]
MLSSRHLTTIGLIPFRGPAIIIKHLFYSLQIGSIRFKLSIKASPNPTDESSSLSFTSLLTVLGYRRLQTKQIYQQLKVIDDKLTSIGYLPDRSQAPLVDATNDGSKEYSLRLHSESVTARFLAHKFL